MKPRTLILTLVLTIGLGAIWSEVAAAQARPRSGGGGGGGQSGPPAAGARARSGPPPSAGAPSSAPPRNVAVPRRGPAPDPGGRVGGWYGGPRGYPYSYRTYYRPYYHSFSIGFGWGYYPFYWSPAWYGYWGYPYYYYPFHPYYPAGYGASLRVQVTPKDAEVYVDGAYAGIVDDFDGTFQRLSLEPGSHTITLYRDGFRSVSQDIYFRYGETFRLRFTMEPLAPGEPPDPRPQPLPRPVDRDPYYVDPQRRGVPAPPEPREPMPPRVPAAPPEPGYEVESSNFGALAIQVQPAGAEVVIDGEVWQAPSESRRLVIQLRPGVHRVEVRKQGLETFRTEVRVTAGETATLNVSLSGLNEQ